MGQGFVSRFIVNANTASPYWDLVVRGAPNDSGSLFLQANNIAQQGYDISYPWFYKSDTANSGDTALYLGIRNDSGNSANFSMQYLRMEQLQLNANIYYAVNSIFGNIVNSAANTVATFANGTLVLVNANINFNNTSTVNVAASANGTTQANVSFTVNTSAINATLTPGSNTDIIFNNNGKLGASPNLTWADGAGVTITGGFTVFPPAGFNSYFGAANGQYGIQVAASQNVGNSLGVTIQAGTNASDFALNIVSGINQNNYLVIPGNGVIQAVNARMSNAETRLMSGLAAFMTANTQRTNNTMTNEANLTITVNETGTYKLDGLLYMQANTANVVAGFNVDFQGGSSTFKGLVNFVGQQMVSSIVRVTQASTGVPQGGAPPNNPACEQLSGMLTFTGTGTFIPRYAQFSPTSANALILLANSYITLTKIG